MRAAMLAAMLALVSLGACGLGPAPAPATEVSTNGTGPWDDLGPAVVCLGDQVLDAPGGDAGGFCASVDAMDVACVADGDCGTREACVCGRCTVAYCNDAADCTGTRTCNFAQHRCDQPCETNFICGDVAQCIAGVCRGRCAVTTDCQHGEICNSMNVCVVDDCSEDSTCADAQRCSIQRLPQQVLAPSPVATPAGIVMYLDLADPALADQRAIWRAISTDGVHFAIEPNHAVLTDTLSARAPDAVIDGGLTYLYYEHGDGTELRVATSVDGITFGPPTTVLVGPDVHAPAALHLADGSVALYYQHADGDGLALATGAPLGQLRARGIVLTPAEIEVGAPIANTAFWTPVFSVQSPHVLLAGPPGAQTIHLWFSAFGVESSPAMQFGQTVAIPANFSIGFASADVSDLLTFTVWPYGPVFDRVEAFLDHREDLDPAAVMLPDNTWFLYEVDAAPASTTATGADGPFTLGRLEVLTD